MQNINDLGENIILDISKTPKFKGNEAELVQVKLRTSSEVGEILDLNTDLLLRNCIIGDNLEHNREIIEIYDNLMSINELYESQKLDYRLNIVPHFLDNDGNIYIKDLSVGGDDFNVYDMMPDGYYIDQNKKDKSKFKLFKEAVREFDLNRVFIISKLFEQLAILHANNFVVGKLKFEDKSISHPTLSLFLYTIFQNNGKINQDIFIHDIHNLELLNNPTSFDYINHMVGDLKNMAFDIIRFFKGIGIPNGGFKKYGETLKKINPELYQIMNRSFLRNPLIEIDMHSIIDKDSQIGKSKKTATKVSKHIEKKELIKDKKSILDLDNIFYLKSKKDKINSFFQNITPENTQIIFDFDGTISYSGKNSLNIALKEDGSLKDLNSIDLSNIILRKGFITFLKLLLSKGYDVKIYSLGFKEIIQKILLNNGIDFDENNIFSNSISSIDNLIFDKSSIPISFDENKKKLVFGDNIGDFYFTNDFDLRFGFFNFSKDKSSKQIDFNKNTDIYFIEKNANFIDLYYYFR